MSSSNPDRVLEKQATVEATIPRMWDAWTTEEGIKSFFSPACNVELKVDGPFEILFDPGAEPGSRGAEGCRILAFQPEKMLAFTWNAPPHLAEVRKQWTHVVVRFKEAGLGSTSVTIRHDGWGEGGEWDQAFEYFDRAWEVVLRWLGYRFERGPIDWDNPPKSV
jgi:uncharacterized protein YndB with AHSA1/START domain